VKAILRSKWFWKVWVTFCFSSVIAGVVILNISQLEHSTSIFEQIRTGNAPILSLISIAMIALPPLISYLLISKERKYNKEEVKSES